MIFLFKYSYLLILRERIEEGMSSFKIKIVYLMRLEFFVMVK